MAKLYFYLLKLYLDRTTYDKFCGLVDRELLRSNFRELHYVLEAIERLYKSTEQKQLTEDDLGLSIRTEYPNMREDAFAAVESVLAQIKQTKLSPDISQGILEGIRKSQHAAKVADTAYRVSLGEVEYDELIACVEGGPSVDDVAGEEGDGFVPSKLDSLLNEAYLQPGLRWRLNTMNRMLGSLRKGDFGFLMARPETGKTTFLASEVSFMAEQANAPILWFNNEEAGGKVMLRIITASLGVPLAKLIQHRERADAAFLDRTGGRIRLVDDAVMNRTRAEAIIKAEKPALIVFDQLDKVKGFADDRKDLELGAIYRWAREIAKTYAPVIAVCQASAEADWVRWLDMSHAANAKTEKQAEADWILGIGRTNREGHENERYLHLSKNKLMGDPDTLPEWRHGKQAVYINPEIARYEDVG